MKMAQMGSPSKSLVGNSFQWTRPEISLDLYGPPKLNLLGGKIRARVFIRMIRNLPFICEGVGASLFQAYPMH